ncbi:MAG TPA: hypothetical protein VMS73_03585 [Anaerolineaceae bacterium]|nr:hypothetical protein [Anaerolineaceae bacterium]
MPTKTIYHRMKGLNARIIELRLHRHPVMIRLIMNLFDCLPLRFNRATLDKYCQAKTMVILHPIKELNHVQVIS